ncbi:MFS transporter [Pseudomonas syringae]|uniref:MFS transporter n=1 Tax=Pseudomonas syringae TaxID=317 RepID=UPI001F243B2C|nr:MFS transporter [Pseudomonas syringae]MCF5227128.1 MFS transporter [Pseudomonas syringae]MCF5241801.1 MFS transporter [Pseudomonas syringae]
MYKTSNLTAIKVATCLGYLVVQLDVSVVNVGLGALKSAFNTNLTGLQWVINSYALVFSALLILGGGLGDKLGAKRVFVFGFAVFTLASAGCGMATSMPMLIAMRCVQGIGAAFLIPTSLTLIRQNFNDLNQRRSAVALWGACGGIALAAGPVLGGIMIEHLGWRSVFLINIPLGILAIILTLRFTPASLRIDKKIDVAGQISIAISLALLTYALTEASSLGWSVIPVSSMGLAALALAVFMLVETKAQAPMLPARLARNNVLLGTMFTGAVINLTFFGVVFVLSIYFQTILHYDALHTGLAFIPLTAVMTVSSLTSARIAKRISALSIMTTGLALQIVGFALLSQLGPESSFWLLNGALMIIGIGSASTVPSMNNSMLAAVSPEDAGMASGLMSSARQLGGVVGVAVFGILIASDDSTAFGNGMSESMWVCVAALVICILLNQKLVRVHPASAQAQ